MYIPTACTCFARLRERGCAGGVGGGGGQFCDTDVCGLMWAVRNLFLVQCVLNS